MKATARVALLLTCVACILNGQSGVAPDTLPATATCALERSLKSAERHAHHVWRDTPPLNPDGRVTAYVEIPLGDRRKWEFDMSTNARAVDRTMPADIGGYPVNYGFIPQTISYDGDPFDALVLGPPLPGGKLVTGAVMGLMVMEDEKGHDAKVVLSPIDLAGRPAHQLTQGTRDEIGGYFRIYKRHEPGGFSKVSGWRPSEDAQEYLERTHAFFVRARSRASHSISIPSPCPPMSAVRTYPPVTSKMPG